MVTDKSGGFFLCKTRIDDKEAHLLVDSGAQLEIAMTKGWAAAQGKNLKEAGKGSGLAGQAQIFTTSLDSLDVGGAIVLNSITANAIDRQLGIPFAKPSDGTTPKVDGLIGSRFLMQARAVINYPERKLQIPGPGTAPDAFLKQCQTEGKRCIPLRKNVLGGPYVPLRFGDKEFIFLIDNAAGSNVIVPEVAKEIGLILEETRTNVTGAGGSTAHVKRGIANQVEIGGVIKLTQLDFIALPTPGGDCVPEGTRYGGILGNSFLSELKVCLDFGSYHMILPALGKAGDSGNSQFDSAPEVHGGVAFEKVPLTPTDSSGHDFVPVSVEGRDTRFLLDSGAGTMAILSTPFAEFIGVPLTKIADGGAVGGSLKMQSTRLSAFKVGPFPRLKLSGLQVADLSKAGVVLDGVAVRPDGLLGAQFLDISNAVFDARGQGLRIPPKDTPDDTYLKSVIPHAAKVVPLLKGGMFMPFIDIEIQGKVRSFLIDTGAGGNSLVPDFADELDLNILSEDGALSGAGELKVQNVKEVDVENVRLGGDWDLGRTRFLVHPIGAKVILPAEKKFGGIIGTKTLLAIDATLDFGSYSLVVRSRPDRK